MATYGMGVLPMMPTTRMMMTGITMAMMKMLIIMIRTMIMVIQKYLWLFSQRNIDGKKYNAKNSDS